MYCSIYYDYELVKFVCHVALQHQCPQANVHTKLVFRCEPRSLSTVYLWNIPGEAQKRTYTVGDWSQAKENTVSFAFYE